MKLEDLQVGDVVTTWYDTGAFGMTLIYWRVVKVCPVFVRVEGERATNGRTRLIHPAEFNRKLDPKHDRELVAEIAPRWLALPPWS